MKKGFTQLFSESWKEYKTHFKTFLILVFLFSVIPSFILLLVQPSAEAIQQGIGAFFTTPYIVTILFVWVLNIILGTSLIYFAIYNKKGKMTYQDALKGGLGYFWKYLGLSIIMMIFLAILFSLLIVPGIIFMIYWIFASYILIAEKKPVMKCLSRSRQIVKGKWWRVLGYALLLLLIFLAISIVIGIPGGILSGLSIFLTLPKYLLLISETITNGIISIITTPLMILFMKNFYLDMKTGK